MQGIELIKTEPFPKDTNIDLIFADGDAKELLRVIDSRLSSIYEYLENDNLDILGDSAELFTGLGFVALQRYINTVCKAMEIEKERAFKLGPQHSGGFTIIRIIDDAANYWKHSVEWGRNEEANKKPNSRKKIIKTFESLGRSIDEAYPLTCILFQISQPKKTSLIAALENLERWKMELIQAQKPNNNAEKNDP